MLLKTKLSRLAIPFVLFSLLTAASMARADAVKTVEFKAPSIGRSMKYNIVLPKGYDGSTDRYPVLYLLHGLTGNYGNWSKMGVPKFALGYDLIVVMPDAGNSWYVNWSKSEEGQENRWEDYMIKDLIGHVDATYRTVASREGRAINGLSMGGYGALMLGLKHPEMFGSIGSHSGAIGYAKRIGERIEKGEELPPRRGEPSTTANAEIGIEGFSSPAERSPKGKVFVTKDDCDAYDPFKLVLKVPHDKLPHIYLDCGTEDGLIKSNQEFVKLLMDNKVPFTYAQSDGGHNPPYWAREVGHSMAVQYHILQRLSADKPKP